MDDCCACCSEEDDCACDAFETTGAGDICDYWDCDACGDAGCHGQYMEGDDPDVADIAEDFE